MEIFAGNLSFETTREYLASEFGKFGDVSNIKMLTDRDTGRFRGIAFISMNDVSQGNDAIKNLNGSELLGRRMKVEASRPREDRPFGGNRRPFGGGGKPFEKRR